MTFPEAVPLAGYASGGGGTLPVLGGIIVEIVGNVDLVLTLTQADPNYVQVTSDGTSTTIRKVVVPLIPGKEWIVENEVSDGQAIQVVGSSGYGVFILPGACAWCITDGTNVFSPSQDAQYPVTVTYQPGSVPSGTIFTSFPALIQYITVIVNMVGYQGNITIRFDGNFNNGSCSIPACAFPGTNLTFQGISTSPGVPVDLEFAAGITFPGITAAGGSTEAYLSITNCFIEDHNTTTLANTNGNGALLLITLTGSQWSQNVPTLAGTESFSATNGGGIGVNATNSIIQQGGPPGNTRAFVRLDTGQGSFGLHNLSDAVVGPYAFQGGDAGVIQVLMGNGSSIATHSNAAAFDLISVSSDSLIAASLIPQIASDGLIDLARFVAYNPTSSSNWTSGFGTVPTEVAQALDLIAAKLA